jgi:hypothetical protein
MKAILQACLALAATVSAAANAQIAFVRPDCPAADAPHSAEVRCIRDARRQVQQSNFDALQKTGLMFRYLARPDLDRYPEAKAAIERKVEGSFTVRFDVAPDGAVYNVRALDVTSGIEPLAKMWAETIAAWTFVKTGQAVTDVVHRRVYLYPRQDEAESRGKPQASM